MARIRRQKVEEAVEAILDFFDLGRSLPRKLPHKEAYDQSIVDREAKRRGINPDTIRKARQFADAPTGYSEAEVQALCRLIREVQNDREVGEPVFGKTHLIRLLSVPKRTRQALARRAIEKSWSVADLEAEIARRFGTRRQGGGARSSRGRRPPAWRSSKGSVSSCGDC